ncbi:hypothetical protein ACQCPP_12460 [Priestia megaterium]|uniref:hypothetical protein n=1 Tax=Priestia megaterium TaxID=1404 RepID=UPI003CFBE2D0
MNIDDLGSMTIDLRKLLGDDVIARFNAYAVLIEQGKLNANDVRRLEGLDVVDE